MRVSLKIGLIAFRVPFHGSPTHSIITHMIEEVLCIDKCPGCAKQQKGGVEEVMTTIIEAAFLRK